MIKTPLYLITLFFVFICTSSAQTWERYYGTSGMEEGNDIIVTSDGSYLASASAGDALYDRKRLYLVKTNTSGTILWSKFITPSKPAFFSLIESPDHFYYVSSVYSLIKLTENGDIVWIKNYSNPSDIAPSRFVFDPEGNLLGVSGSSIKIYSSETGEFMSSKTFGRGVFFTIINNSAGGYIIGGRYNNSNTYNPIDAYFLSVNANLDSLWAVNVPCNTGYTSISQMIEHNNQFYAAVVGCNSWVGTNNCWYNNSSFIALSASGQVLEKFSTGAGYSSFQSMAIKDDGTIIGFGSYGSNYPVSLSFFEIDTVFNQLTYPPASMRQDLAGGQKIIALGNDSFLAVASTKGSGHGIMDLAILKMDANRVTNTKIISGKVILDNNKNCNTNESNFLSNQIVKASSSEFGTFYSKTDALGIYTFRLPLSDYKVTHIPSRYKYINCPADGHDVSLTTQNPVVLNKNFYDTTFIPSISTAPFLKVDISSGRKRPCFRSTYSIKYSNEGTQAASSVNIVLTKDPHVSIISASKLFSVQDNSYTFTIGNLPIKASGVINIVDSVACINQLTGLTKCAQVKISYDTLFALPLQAWDKSSIVVKGYCDGGDTVRFVIKNKGQNMSAPSQFRIYESDGLRMSSPFQLIQNDTLLLSMYANGNTFRLEADQSSGHPLYSEPSVTVEACGNDIAVFPSGYINSRPLDDKRYSYDEVCNVLVNSYDPNEKSVVPTGLTAEHYIKDNTRLKYHIDFQNMGTDVAYTVVLRDTLSSHLDPTSIVWGASSHPYEWDILENGILEITFNNVNLPDKNTNELGSQGYVTFEVGQNLNNPLGTVIKNKAGIFFDYNEAIITNEVFHTINNDANPGIPNPPNKTVSVVPSTSFSDLVSVYPNPSRETILFELLNTYDGNFNLVIKDLNGNEVFRKENISERTYRLSTANISSGIFIYSIYREHKALLGHGKIIILD